MQTAQGEDRDELNSEASKTSEAGPLAPALEQVPFALARSSDRGNCPYIITGCCVYNVWK